MTETRVLLAAGAAYGLLGVVLGAFGAHALRERLSAEMSAVWQTAVQYHFWHALALLAVGVWLLHRPSTWLLAAGAAFSFGILLFSGSLYVLAVTGLRNVGAITPLGGVLLLVGWACLLPPAFRA